MAYVEIPDLLYKGAKVYVQDNVVVVPPPPATPGVFTIDWSNYVGQRNVNLTVGKVFTFGFTIPPNYNSNKRLCYFKVSPHDGTAYWNRQITINQSPGIMTGTWMGCSRSGQEPTLYFSVGGYPVSGYLKTPDTRNPDLVAGQTYYINVLQTEGVNCSINYGLGVM